MRYHRNTVNVKTPKPNGSDTAPSQPAATTPYRSRVKRTLFTASVFALLAMIYVPTPRERGVHSAGYRLIFSGEDTSIAFFQLLANVVFAALLGAILATTMPKITAGVRRLPTWVWRGIGGIVSIALLSTGAVAYWNLTEAAQGDERYAYELLRGRHDIFDQAEAESYFRSAARYWRLALRFDEATRVENRIKELQKRTAQDWPGVPVVDLSGLPDQAPRQAAKDAPHGFRWANELGFVPDQPSKATPTSIPRARPVQKSMFDDLIPARTATPAR